jgi:diadenosine tetraphosphatase ApaH/serine/threonine PP2A family protein phosphatase
MTALVLIALFSDIHGNREAFEACLADASRRAIGRYVFLGDYVGYGADPCFAVDTVREFVERGAIALVGNHDCAAVGTRERMNDEAMQAIEWTSAQLHQSHVRFLGNLSLSAQDGDRLYVHASAAFPASWEYVIDERAASRSLHATSADRTFCGHTHVPAVFCLTATGKIAAFEPTDGSAMPLAWQRRWVAVIGAVGQPRDRNPLACYALFDDATNELTYIRIPYDIETAQRKIRDAGLPSFLAARLAWGR